MNNSESRHEVPTRQSRQTTTRLLACTAAVAMPHRCVAGGAGWGPGQGGRGGGAPAVDANAPTPKLPSGKPDLTGSWQAGGLITGSGVPGIPVGDMFRRCTPFQNKTCMEWTNQSIDWVFMSTSRLGQNQPMYKPEHWNKVIELDQWTNKYDPVGSCLPLGVPRQGPPARIFHTDNDITMIYRAGVDGAGGYAEFRMVPINGKPHDPNRPNNYSYMGYTVGRWEGDYARARLHRVLRRDLAGARRLLPLRRDAGRGEVHAGSATRSPTT